MSAFPLLAELSAAGITLVPDGDNLRVLAPAGVDLKPYVSRIREMKTELLQASGAGTVAPDSERSEYVAPTDSRQLTRAEAEVVGLNPQLTWLHVACRGEVDPTVPPLDWDGVLPATCRHPRLCPRLGPCPHALTHCVSASKGA